MEEGIGSLMDRIKKNIIVCVDRECKRLNSMSCCCPSCEDFVPDDCEFAIFHPLETTGANAEWRKRRSGKTTELVRIANVLVSKNVKVYYFTPTLDQARYIKRHHQLDDGVKMFSVGQLKTGDARGFVPGYIISDELNPSQIEEVKEVFMGSKLVAAYWT